MSKMPFDTDFKGGTEPIAVAISIARISLALFFMSMFENRLRSSFANIFCRFSKLFFPSFFRSILFGGTSGKTTLSTIDCI
ncbi:MAG: hypothetical protein WCW47_01880 [Candidatus Paceibacterota bacterium]